MDRPISRIDLSCIRGNAQRIARDVGVSVIAVIKANAYGLGARQIVAAISDVVAGFYCFTLDEAIDARTVETGKPTITLLSGENESAERYLEHNARPAVWSVDRAKKLRDAHPVLAVDTGMQRFACPREQITDVIRAGGCDEAFTHATKPEHARMLKEWCAGLRLHAASSALLEIPEARLDAVRPGLALYRDAVRIITRLIETRESNGPIGYGGVISSTGRHGVIAGGYTTGVKVGVCSINGAHRAILESGMQSSFVELGAHDHTGDEVVLLGEELPIETVAGLWKTTPQESLWRMTSAASRSYISE